VIVTFCALILLLIFLAPSVLSRGSTGPFGDRFGPARMAAALHIITTIPYLLLVSRDAAVVSSLILKHPSIPDLDVAIIWYAAVQGLAFVMLMLGISTRFPAGIVRKFPIVGESEKPKRVYIAAAVFLVVGFVSYIVLIRTIGGADYLINNLHRRGRLAQGLGYLSSLVPVFSFGILLLIYSWRYRPSLIKFVAVCVTVPLAVVMFSSFGGRKLTLHLLVFGVLVWNYGVRPIRRVVWKGILLSLVVIPYFVAMPLLRSQGGVERFISSPALLGSEIVANLSKAVTGLSYVDSYLFIINHFQPDRIWWGRTYLDLVTAPIPSSLYRDKPPIDDGVYVRTLVGGEEVRPPTSRRELYPSSWPPETLGTMYMNFWIPGVLLGMFILGCVYRGAYEYMRWSKYTLFSILSYGVILANFHLSNLRIVQVSTRLTMMVMLFTLLFGAKVKRTARNRKGVGGSEVL